MTHLERFVRAAHHQPVDRAPCGFSATPEMGTALEAYAGMPLGQLVYQRFDVDRRWAQPKYVGRPLSQYEDGSYESAWGVRLKHVSFGHGVYEEAVHSPLQEMDTPEEIAHYPNWLSPDAYDYASLGPQLAAYPDYPFTVGYLSLGWFAWQLRGMEQHLEDLLAAPRMAEATLGPIAEWGVAYFQRLLEENQAAIARNLCCIHLADDFGTQNGLLISPALYRRYYQKCYRTIADLAHRHGVLVEFHSCGAVAELVPDLIETGIDILNPLQTSAQGMDPMKLKRLYGRVLAFSGGVDVQQILPRLSQAEVQAEVHRLLTGLDRDGGYILEPSHAIQVGTPPENVLAMYRAYREHYGLACDF